MYKNPHIDSVERNGVGIFRVLNWQAGAFVSKIIRVRIIQLRIIYSFLRKTSMIVPSGMASIYRRMLTFEGCSFGERTKSNVHFSHAREKEPKSALPPRPPSKGDATAPPVALTLMYPRPIKGSGCFY